MVVFPDLGERQLHTLAALGAQIPLRGVGVIARGDAHVEDFLERVATRLAVLQLNEVEHLVLASQHEVVETQQHRGALRDRAGRPLRLHVAGAAGRRLHVGACAVRHVSQRFAGHRVHDIALPAGVGGVDVTGQVFQSLIEVVGGGLRRHRG